MRRYNRSNTLLAISNTILFVEEQASDLRLSDDLRMEYAVLANRLKIMFDKEDVYRIGKVNYE